VFEIAVILVTYNNASTLKKCLHSLSRVLTDFHSQLLLIDNKSTDTTPDILNECIRRKQLSFDAVELILNADNKGYTSAVNQGLEKSRGEYILFLNPDIYFADTPFPTLIKYLSENKQVGVIAPQLRHLNGAIQPSCRTFPLKRDVLYEVFGLSRVFKTSSVFNRWKMGSFDHKMSRDVHQPQGAFLLTRKMVIQSVGVLDNRFPMFFSDVDWCYRVWRAGWTIRFCAGVFVYHGLGTSVRQKKSQMMISSHRSFVDYFEKYDSLPRDRLYTLGISALLLVITPVRLFFSAIKTSGIS